MFEDATLHAFENPVLADAVGVAFVVQLVEFDAHGRIGRVEPGVHPGVHGLPEGHGVRISGFPEPKCILGFEQEGGGLLGFLLGQAVVNECLHFRFVGLVECHVILADQLVALHSAGFRGLAFANLRQATMDLQM